MFYGHLHSRDAMNTDRLWPRPYADELAAAGIVIDADGRRFADEGLRRRLFVQRRRPSARSARRHRRIRPADLGRTARPQPCAAAQSADAGGGRHAASRRHDRGAGRTDRHRAAAAAGHGRARTTPPSTPARCICFRRRARSDRYRAWPIRTRAVLRHADLRGHHQHHGRHRGERQRRGARPERQADPRPVTRQARPSAGWTAGRTPATSAG